MISFCELMALQRIGNDPRYHMRMLAISRPHAQALVFTIIAALYATEPHVSG